jgi:ABC-2 type transport system ATP-binding protein
LGADRRVRVRVDTDDVERARATLARLGLSEIVARGGSVSATLDHVPAERVVAALVHDDVGVRGFVAERPSLEDLFVELTGSGFDVSG